MQPAGKAYTMLHIAVPLVTHFTENYGGLAFFLVVGALWRLGASVWRGGSVVHRMNKVTLR